MTVTGVVLAEDGAPLRLEPLDLPAPDPGHVRVRLAAAGVCHSDVALVRGDLGRRLPVVPGHEGAGYVAAVGDGVGRCRVGDAVVLVWSMPCGRCAPCRRGEPYLCTSGRRTSQRPYGRLPDGTPVHPGLGVGAFATETTVPETAVVTLGGDVPLDEAALLGCAGLTGVGAARDVAEGESVAVVGLGAVGLCAVQAARIAGAATILAVDPSAERRATALRLGATAAGTPDDVDARVDHAIECAGTAAALRLAWDLTRRGGTTVVLGVGREPVAFHAAELVHSGRRLLGCRHGNAVPDRDIPRLLAHLRAGRLDVRSLITERIGLDGVPAALDRLGGGIRTLVTF